jgi:hypothetical protein
MSTPTRRPRGLLALLHNGRTLRVLSLSALVDGMASQGDTSISTENDSNDSKTTV